MKKKLIVLLNLLLCLSLVAGFSGCNRDGTPGTTTTRATTTRATTTAAGQSTTATDLFEKTLEISWIGLGSELIVDDNWVQKQLEEKFNIRITNVKMDIHNTEQMNLMVAAGEMPDAGFSYHDPKVVYEQGATRTTPKEFIENNSPNYTKLLNQYPLGWVVNLAEGTDDEYMSLTGLSLQAYFTYMDSWYRLDWLENLGIEPKGDLIKLDDRLYFTSTPFEHDEMIDIFRRFTKDDPNRSGANDTYALSGCEYDNYSFGPFFYSFGLPHGHGMGHVFNNVIENGEVMPVAISQNYKKLLNLLSSLYSEGLIDPEWTTLDLTTYWEKITSGQIGWWPNPGSYSNPAIIDRAPYSVLNTNPNAKILVTPAVKNPDGNTHIGTWTPTPIAYNFFIGSKVDDEKLERILKIFDYVNFGEEKVRFYFGVEGEHFEWNGEPYNSSVTEKEGIVKAELGLYFYQHVFQDDEWMIFAANKEYRPILDFALTDEAEQMRITNYRIDLFGETATRDIRAQYGSEIDSIRGPFFYRAITGEINIDAEWDSYVSRMKAAGVDKIMQEFLKMPILPKLLEGEIEY